MIVCVFLCGMNFLMLYQISYQYGSSQICLHNLLSFVEEQFVLALQQVLLLIYHNFSKLQIKLFHHPLLNIRPFVQNKFSFFHAININAFVCYFCHKMLYCKNKSRLSRQQILGPNPLRNLSQSFSQEYLSCCLTLH